MGCLGGTYYWGGNNKVPTSFTKVPNYEDPNDPGYGRHGCMAIHTIVHGGKHVIAGNEAIDCEDDGDIAKCFNAHGFVPKHHQPEARVGNPGGTVATVRCPPMICMVKSATSAYYKPMGENPEDAGSVTVIHSQVITHRDVGGEAEYHTWLVGTTIFEVTMPKCNMMRAETCVGYWKGGKAIRKSDIAKCGLDPSNFDRVTRCGYQRIRIQVVHLNCKMAHRHGPCRTALRRIYEHGAAQGVAIICGDFNGCAYRPSQGPQNTPELTPDQIVDNIKFPMCLEECQYVVDAINKDKPLSQRVGLLFRHSTSLAGTHYRPSEGSTRGLHGFDPDVTCASDTMVVMCLCFGQKLHSIAATGLGMRPIQSRLCVT
jgi:hypothetical protein